MRMDWSVNIYQRQRIYFLKAYHAGERRYREKRMPPDTTRRDAETARRQWEHELNTSSVSIHRVRLSAAIEAFEQTHLATLRPRSATRYMTALRRLLADVGDVEVSRLSTGAVASSVVRYVKAGHTTAGAAAYARHIKAFAKWMIKRGMVENLAVDIPRTDDTPVRPGCPGEIFDRVLEKVGANRPDRDGWKRLVLICRHGGFRLNEALSLRWGADSAVGVVRTKTGWQFVLAGSGQKSRKTETVPATPAMARLLDQWSATGHHGRVAQLRSGSMVHAGRIVKLAFAAAGAVGSAHALRREFCREWAGKLSAADLMKLARHSSINTTLKFYLDQQTDGLAMRLAMTETAKRQEQPGSLAESLAADWQPSQPEYSNPLQGLELK